MVRCFFIRWDQLCLDLDNDQGSDPNNDDSEEANTKIGILLKLRRYAAWSPLGLAGFTTGEVSPSRLVAAQSEESLLSSLFASSLFYLI